MQPAAAQNARVGNFDRPSIAVLPFADLSDDPGQNYFCDGIVEEITAALSRPAGSLYRPQLELTYKSRAIDVKQVGRELGVR